MRNENQLFHQVPLSLEAAIAVEQVSQLPVPVINAYHEAMNNLKAQLEKE
jgi:hypothetical protein